MGNKLTGAIAAGLVLAVIGAVSVWVGEAWLIPSLGSAVFVQTMTPEDPGGRGWNTAMGQILGLAGGFAGVFITGAVAAPHFTGHHALLFVRVAAIALSVFFTAILQFSCDAVSPAGGAIAIIVATGSKSASWSGLRDIVAGIALVTVFGEIARQFILRRKRA